jgi:hypothetical protein
VNPKALTTVYDQTQFTQLSKTSRNLRLSSPDGMGDLTDAQFFVGLEQ